MKDQRLSKNEYGPHICPKERSNSGKDAWRTKSWNFPILHLSVGLLLSIVALLIFADIVDDVRERDDLARFDVAILDIIHRHATNSGIEIAKAVTFSGSVAWIVILGLVVAAILYRKAQRLMLAGWTAALAGAGVLDVILKWTFHRPRPQWVNPLVVYPHWNWSFPSGHATGSVVTYGMLAYLISVVWLHSFRTRAVVISLSVVLILAIGFSRLYLGVHYPTDVTGGLAAGCVWLTTCITGLEVARRRGMLSLAPA